MANARDLEAAQRLLAEINHTLQTESLTETQRTELQNHANALAGSMLRPWLPCGLDRRLIMLAIIALGVQQALIGNYEALAWWLILPIFSPRVIGEAYYAAGRIRGMISRL